MSWIHVGTRRGLAVFRTSDRASGTECEFVRTLLPDLWISSITTPQPRALAGEVLATSRLGHVAIIEGDHIAAIERPSERLWFATPYRGRILVGSTPAALLELERDLRGGRESRDVERLSHELGWSAHSTGGAHLHTLSVMPWDEDEVLVAAEVGGVLRSTDGGRSWRDSTFNLDRDVHKIVASATGDRQVYAATGTGVFVRGHRDETWQRLGPPELSYVQALVQHPTEGTITVSASARPFGRHDTGPFTGTDPNNDFGVFSLGPASAEWLRLDSVLPGRMAGVLSKALTIEAVRPYALIVGTLDGRLYRVAGGKWQLLVDGLAPIECVAVDP